MCIDRKVPGQPRGAAGQPATVGQVLKSPHSLVVVRWRSICKSVSHPSKSGLNSSSRCIIPGKKALSLVQLQGGLKGINWIAPKKSPSIESITISVLGKTHSHGQVWSHPDPWRSGDRGSHHCSTALQAHLQQSVQTCPNTVFLSRYGWNRCCSIVYPNQGSILQWKSWGKPSLALQVFPIEGNVICFGFLYCTGFMPPTGGLIRAASNIKASGSALKSFTSLGSCRSSWQLLTYCNWHGGAKEKHGKTVLADHPQRLICQITRSAIASKQSNPNHFIEPLLARPSAIKSAPNWDSSPPTAACCQVLPSFMPRSLAKAMKLWATSPGSTFRITEARISERRRPAEERDEPHACTHENVSARNY